MFPCCTLQRDWQGTVRNVALRGVLGMMEFREGNEDLRCYSIKSKSSREIQRLSLLCWVKVEKGKKKNLFCFPKLTGL